MDGWMDGVLKYLVELAAALVVALEADRAGPLRWDNWGGGGVRNFNG